MVYQQPGHALGFVVVDPVGGLGQTLDAEVFDELFEAIGHTSDHVAVALAPDEEGRAGVQVE